MSQLTPAQVSWFVRCRSIAACKWGTKFNSEIILKDEVHWHRNSSVQICSTRGHNVNYYFSFCLVAVHADSLNIAFQSLWPEGRCFLREQVYRCQSSDHQRDRDCRKKPNWPPGWEANHYVREKGRNGQAERNSFQQWAETQQPHIVADVNLAVRQQPKEKRERYREEIQGGDTGSERASEKRERAEVVGEAEADSTLNLCKTARKALIREMESCCRGGRRDMRREKSM